MIIFFTRFSVVTETGGFAHLGEWFHRTERLPRVLRKIARLRRSKPAGTEMLFSDARMDFRFACFETLTLPSLAGQTDRDFVHVVLYAQELPERYKRRLQDLSARHGFLLHDMDRKTSFEQKYVEVCKTLTGSGAPSGWLATGRIDDDDAVNVGYVGWLRAVAEAGHRDIVVSTHSTVSLLIGHDGPHVEVQSKPFVASGLSYIEASNVAPRTIGGAGAHHIVYQTMTTLLLPNANAILLSAHVHNDSRRFSNRIAPPAPMAGAESMLREAFNIDLGSARRALIAA